MECLIRKDSDLTHAQQFFLRLPLNNLVALLYMQVTNMKKPGCFVLLKIENSKKMVIVVVMMVMIMMVIAVVMMVILKDIM